MWSDNETSTDYINFKHYEDAICQIVDTNELLPCSIGIFGDWGSGKSSLMKMIESRYSGKEKEGILTIRFNGWLFEGYEDAKTVLMGRIVEEISRHCTLDEKAKKVAIRLFKKIDLLKVGSSIVKFGIGAALGPAGLLGITATEIFKSLKDEDYEGFFKSGEEKEETSRSSIQDFGKDFAELLSTTKLKKIIVLIDDLDRCNPDTVIGTLEAIKLFLFVDNSVFIIGADERLIKYSVRRRFPEITGDKLDVGRDYLEKLIQFPVRIASMNAIELTNYINLLFVRLYLKPNEVETLRQKVLTNDRDLKTKGLNAATVQQLLNQTTIDSKLSESLDVSFRIATILTAGLNGNPRQAKRFLNTLMMRTNMANSRGIILESKLLAKLMLLEYFQPETFKRFNTSQAENEGCIAELVAFETNKEIPADLESLIQDKWFQNWLEIDPKLGELDLASYFYYSQDKLSVVGAASQRMSPEAQEFYQSVKSPSDLKRKRALERATSLSQADAAAVFEALANDVRRDEKANYGDSILKKLVEFCSARKDLVSQLVQLLNSLPEGKLNIAMRPALQELARETVYAKSIEPLIEKLPKPLKSK
ncbi:KAP family P-loop NTPase fold protein [Spirosoma pomorum]